MCMTAEMLAVFLNLLDPSIISTTAGQITVNASEQAAVWTITDDALWCTDALRRDTKAGVRDVE
ncbi:MAG: hypothetical protein QNI90_09215 [Dinoroseobacter sp.]|nr:hypothetical protein [Dinoroseobacter sp.]